MPNQSGSAIRHNVLNGAMTHSWVKVDARLWLYVGDDHEKTVVAEIRKGPRAKWQIAIRASDGVMVKVLSASGGVGAAKGLVQANFRSTRKPED